MPDKDILSASAQARRAPDAGAPGSRLPGRPVGSAMIPVLLVTLTMMFSLDALRVFLPAVIWYLGQYIGAIQLALYALGTFATALFAPLVRRALGERGMLALTVGGLALARLGLQFADAALLQLVISTTGIVLLGWFLPFWQQSPRNRPEGSQIPVLVIALPLALILDTGLRSLLWSYPLVWRDSPWAALVAVGLAFLALVQVWAELRSKEDGLALEPTLGRAWPLLGFGPFLYLALAVLHNPSALAVAMGGSEFLAHLVVNGFGALGAGLCVVAAVWPLQRRGLLALLAGGLLVVALFLFDAGVGPALLWHGLATLALWACLGWLLAGTASSHPLRKGLWRSSLAVFLGLVIMLVIVFTVAQYQLSWMIGVAGAILGLAAAWAVGSSAPGARVEESAGLGQAAPPLRLVYGIAALMLAWVSAWALLSQPARPVETADTSQPLRVMTYNIHQGLDADIRMDLDALAAVIRQEQPDILALNEVNRGRATNGFVDTLFYLSHQLELPYVFGNYATDGLYGNAILSRYPIREWENLPYQTNTTEVRGVLWAVVDAPGGALNIYATHLDHIGSADNARLAQVTELLADWNGAPRSILLGDLNAPPQAPELQPVYQAGFADALRLAGLENIFTFWDPMPIPGKRIDFIFLTPDLTALSAWSPETRASDHRPVIAEIEP